MKLKETVSFVQDIGIQESVSLTEYGYVKDGSMYEHPDRATMQVMPMADSVDISYGRNEMADYNITMLFKAPESEEFLSTTVLSHEDGMDISSLKLKVKNHGRSIDRALRDAQNKFSDNAVAYIEHLYDLYQKAESAVTAS